MSYPFAEILLHNGAESYEFENGFDGEKRLRPLAKVNVFVGANNSGKSRLMRALAATPKLNVLPTLTASGIEVPFEAFIAVLEKVKAGVLNALAHTRCEDVNGVRARVENFPFGRYLAEGQGQIGGCISAIQSMTSMQMPSSRMVGSDPKGAIERIGEIARNALAELPPIDEHARSIPETKKLYIPTLRSLRDLGGGDLFADITKNNYFAPNAKHVEVFTGRTLYGDIEQLLRGDLAKRENLRKFETWISETFFRGEPVAIIPRIGETTLTIKIGDEPEQPIHNLGDGIQAILILAFPLFVREENHLLAFIEEPELFLHPWLQRCCWKC